MYLLTCLHMLQQPDRSPRTAAQYGHSALQPQLSSQLSSEVSPAGWTRLDSPVRSASMYSMVSLLSVHLQGAVQAALASSACQLAALP